MAETSFFVRNILWHLYYMFTYWNCSHRGIQFLLLLEIVNYMYSIKEKTSIVIWIILMPLIPTQVAPDGILFRKLNIVEGIGNDAIVLFVLLASFHEALRHFRKRDIKKPLNIFKSTIAISFFNIQ